MGAEPKVRPKPKRLDVTGSTRHVQKSVPRYVESKCTGSRFTHNEKTTTPRVTPSEERVQRESKLGWTRV
eukprot:134898-Pyramimonas_sp.AAC.1